MCLMHLEQVNEDAMSYTIKNVIHWSEEVCKRIFDDHTGKGINWLSATLIEHLQVQRGAADGAAGGEESGWSLPMSSEIKSVIPAPLCRAYNFGSCTSKGDHTHSNTSNDSLNASFNTSRDDREEPLAPQTAPPGQT